MKTLIIAFAVLITSTQLLKADQAQVDKLWDAMRVSEFIDVLSQEGISESEELESRLFTQSNGDSFQQATSRIYDPERMTGLMRTAMSIASQRRDLDSAIDFYQSVVGRKSIEAELSSRFELLDPLVEEESKSLLNALRTEDPERFELIDDYVLANDLVENNLVGAMNGNYVFLSTLTDAGQGPYVEDPSAILPQIWAQENEVRASTSEWVYSYFAYAYRDLSNAEILKLIEFSRSEGGQSLNNFLFESTNFVFDQLAMDLANVVAEFLASEAL